MINNQRPEYDDSNEDEQELVGSSVALFDESEFVGIFSNNENNTSKNFDNNSKNQIPITDLSSNIHQNLPSPPVERRKSIPIQSFLNKSPMPKNENPIQLNPPSSSLNTVNDNLSSMFIQKSNAKDTRPSLSPSPTPSLNPSMMEDLKEQINRLEIDNVTLLEELERVNLKSKDDNDIRLKLESSVEKLTLELESTKSELRELSFNFSRNEKTKNMLLNKTDKIDGLQEENDLLKSEISQISNELLRANSQMSSLIKDVTALRNENEQLISSNSMKIDKESYRWEQKYKEAELQSKRSDEKIRNLYEELSENQRSYDREINELQTKVRNLENELSDINRNHHDEITQLQREIKKSSKSLAPSSSFSSSSSIAQEDFSSSNRRNFKKGTSYDYAEADLNIKPLLKPTAPEPYNFPRSQLQSESSSEYENKYYTQQGGYEASQYAKSNNNNNNNNSSINTTQSSRQKPRSVDEYYDSSYSDNRIDPYESYSVPSSRPKTSSNLPEDPTLINKVPTSLSSRAQSLNVLRQSLASVVENAQSLGRNYTNSNDSKTTNSSTSLADIYNSQFDTNNNNKQDNRKKFNGLTPSPFATESTVKELSSFDELDRNLTKLMTEKTSLDDELEKLHQRGGKTLKERTRSQQIEIRLKDISKDIASIRRQLTSKPF